MCVNDCFTVCEMLHNAYKEALTYKNIVNGFSACGLWSLRGGGVEEYVISAADLTNRNVDESGEQCRLRYQDLVRAFMENRDVLKSDGPNIVNGHLKTTSGALCNREDLLRDLRRWECERAAEHAAREQREAEKQQRRVQRASELAPKSAENSEVARIRELNKKWEMNIQSRWRLLTSSRETRRAEARLRVQSQTQDNQRA